MFRKGERFYLPGVVVYRLKSEKTRFCVLVKKDLGNAVVRNRYKRWFREIFRKNKQWFSGYNLIFYISRKQKIDRAGYLYYDNLLRGAFEGNVNEKNNADSH